MNNSLQPIAKVPFLGQMYEVFLNPKQWQELRFDGKRFLANQRIGRDFEKLISVYEKFCKQQLAKIIDRQVANLRRKKVAVELMYTDGIKQFAKRENLSVDDYLKKINYKQKLEYKIGVYEKEWGINEINPKQKKFILYFNQSLIKYDKGPHIEYVVAHELTHVFHRDHGDQFHATLARIFPRKRTSEEFFKTGISRRFALPNLDISYTWLWFILAIIILAGIYWLFGFVSNFWQDIFGGSKGTGF
jgi:predicted metal-dependent hydrolase